MKLSHVSAVLFSILQRTSRFYAHRRRASTALRAKDLRMLFFLTTKCASVSGM